MSVEENASIFLTAIHVFNDRGLRYLVLRDVQERLPGNIDKKQDIDLLVHPDSSLALNEVLTSMGFRVKPFHGEYLYGMHAACLYLLAGVVFHVFYELAVLSPEKSNPWVPLNASLQLSAWDNRTAYKEWFVLGPDDQFINLILRGVFDKGGVFSDAYLRALESLRPRVDMVRVEQLLSEVFFRFTPCMMKMIRNSQYTSMRKAYLSFEGY